MSVARHHAEWLSLVEQAGPFLSMPVLLRVLPQGLDAHDPDHHRLLKLAHQEWQEACNNSAIHRAWVRFVLTQTLEMPEDVLAEGQAVANLKHEVAEHGETLRPDYAVMLDNKPQLLVQVYPASQDLDRPPADRHWKASCGTRMMELLHATGVRLGLVTNGERWLLVDAPRGDTTGFASWYAGYWQEEPITLRAFRTLLSARRFFSVPEDETLAAMLAESASNQQEVTDQLGYQVRKAVEVLIQSLDRADQDRGRQLLGTVPEAELYEAALTVMMRLVFLFSAEERGLLLLGDPLYDQHYAVSTLRDQLREDADQLSEEVVELRLDAWVRLLATFRAVHGGATHHRLTVPAYGGHLFDPDRFPFLEGRKPGTTWRDTPATPLPVNNRTVLHLLEALQLLQVKVPGGGPAEARRVSFSGLDIEQIGHVYEGLLDHTAKRAKEPVLGLAGTKDKEPEVALAELEQLRARDEKGLLKYLKEVTGRSEPALKKALAVAVEGQDASRFRTACGNDAALWGWVQPFAGLVRLDTFGYPVVIPAGSVYVTEGTDRRSSGTHYTPRSLTEPIVQYTLEPLVYDGPAEGKPREKWRLKTARELLSLKVCDMAIGSGAFLVQACRYLSERLLETWEDADQTCRARSQGNLDLDGTGQAAEPSKGPPLITPFADAAQGRLDEQIIPEEAGDRSVYARRLVAQRCLYGVDKNPMAVEMAKLSLWLLTLARGQPFTFLDHAIRWGDSLVGIHSLKQLEMLHLSGQKAETHLYAEFVGKRIQNAIELRLRLEEMPVGSVEDVQAQEELLRQAQQEIAWLRTAADMLTGAEFVPFELLEQEYRKQAGDDDEARPAPGWLREKRASQRFREFARKKAALQVVVQLGTTDLDGFEGTAGCWLNGQVTFHWPLEFPEVFARRGGFDAFVGNPPFMGGQKITGTLGEPYREYLVNWLANGQRGSADLCAYFFLRAKLLLRQNGMFGLLATNTIAQGDTREVGLDQLTADGLTLPRAVPSRKWPGTANLEVAHVWGRRGSWVGPFMLDDKMTSGVTPFLAPPGTVIGNPHRLKANEDKSFIGSYVLGMGFVLTPEEAKRLIDKDTKNREVLFPYINGQDLNSLPDQSARRWVINFFDWPIERAMEYPECFRIIEEKVKPERQKNNRKERREKWWQYAEKCPALYRTIAGLKRVIGIALTSRTLSPDFLPTNLVLDQTVVVFALPESHAFAVLASSLHYTWVLQHGATLRTDLRYTPSDCFETFPFPVRLPPSLGQLGERYHAHRRQIMLARKQGLTKTYNRFHEPDAHDTDIATLRQLHVEMDQAVAAAYGWPDLDMGHGFHETRQGVRYTISEPARCEVLARLLKLNHERYAEEVARGLHEKKKGSKAKGRNKQEAGGGLFGNKEVSDDR